MSKNQKKPEIEPFPVIPVVPPSIPEITPEPDKNIPKEPPTPEIIPVPNPEVEPIKEAEYD